MDDNKLEYKNKYLEYKKKYLMLKNTINQNGGDSTSQMPLDPAKLTYKIPAPVNKEQFAFLLSLEKKGFYDSKTNTVYEWYIRMNQMIESTMNLRTPSSIDVRTL
jgi:hypothetical protein